MPSSEGAVFVGHFVSRTQLGAMMLISVDCRSKILWNYHMEVDYAGGAGVWGLVAQGDVSSFCLRNQKAPLLWPTRKTAVPAAILNVYHNESNTTNHMISYYSVDVSADVVSNISAIMPSVLCPNL